MSNGKDLSSIHITYCMQRLTSLLHHDIFRGSMKDECILNSSAQQPSPAIQSSLPTPTLHPSSLSSPPSSHVPTVQSKDDTSSVTTKGPTVDASIFPTYDVSERNALIYDLRFCFHSQFVLILISLLLTTRFLHRRGMMKMILNGQHLFQPICQLLLLHLILQVLQNQPLLLHPLFSQQYPQSQLLHQLLR